MYTSFYNWMPVEYKKVISMHQFENRSNLFIQYLIENSLLNSLNHIYQPVCLWLIILLNIQKSIEKHLNLN